MRLIITGPPASGKGSLAPYFIETYKIKHISTGQMFREEINKQTPLGLKLKEILNQGHLVSDDLTDEMVEKRLQEKDVENGFLLDGFPRNLNQAIFLDKLLAKKGQKLDYAIALYADDEILIKRIIGRRMCPTCGKIYNVYFSKPKVEGICDNDATPLIKRSDDTEEVAKERIKVYEELTAPIIKYYQEKGILITADGGLEKSKDTFLEVQEKVNCK